MYQVCRIMAHLKEIILTNFVRRYGNILVGLYHDYKDAESVVNEMMLRVEILWSMTERQLDFLRLYWDMLSESHQLLQNRLLHTLHSKLTDFVVTFTGIVGKGRKLKKFLFAISVKDCLARTVEELNKWQSLFDPSYFLIGLISTGASHFDQNRVAKPGDISRGSSVLPLPRPPSFSHPAIGEVELLRQETDVSSGCHKTSVFVSDAAISSQTSVIPHSSARVARLRESGKMVILDTVLLRQRDEAARMMVGVRELAQVLRTVDPIRFGLLSCHGVIQIDKADTGNIGRARPEKRLAQLQFVFDVPQHLMKPRSLRDILLSPNPQAPLNELLAQAKSLARSVFFIHTKRFVHKNIRPENILVFEDAKYETGKSYLVGFEKFRADREHSMKFGDGLWECDLYRHPERQGSQPEKYFVMQHDIYSLGVVLLEIGLRIPFVTPSDGNTALAPHQELDLHLDKDEPGRAKRLKKTFTDLATQRLPAKMGQIYTDVVLSCLNCLDTNNEAFGDQGKLEDEDGIEVGVRYIEKVWYFPPSGYSSQR